MVTRRTPAMKPHTCSVRSRLTSCRTKRLWQSNLVTTTIGRSIPQSSGRTWLQP